MRNGHINLDTTIIHFIYGDCCQRRIDWSLISVPRHALPVQVIGVDGAGQLSLNRGVHFPLHICVRVTVKGHCTFRH